MAATITLHVWTGTNANVDGGSTPDFSFGTADDPTDDSGWRISNPITIPAAGSAYSYEKYISACIGVVPSNNVGNFQIWGTAPAQTYPTGTCWLVGVAACAAGADPVVTSSTVATSSLGAATSGGKAEWDAASYAAAACQTAYVVHQLQVVGAACVGNWGGANGCALSYSYDEV